MVDNKQNSSPDEISIKSNGVKKVPDMTTGTTMQDRVAVRDLLI